MYTVQLEPATQSSGMQASSYQNSTKIALLILGLLLVGVSAISAYFYYQAEKYEHAYATLEMQQAQKTVEVVNKLPVAQSILPYSLINYSTSPYGGLSVYEKSLVQGYLKADPAVSEGWKFDNPDAAPEDLILVKYYDERTVVLETIGFKYSTVCMYDVKTFEKIGNDCFQSPYVGFKDYLFKIDAKKISYYKKGSLSFTELRGAYLAAGMNETYAAVDGLGGLMGEFIFNENTKELQISVFDSRYYNNGSSTKKIRTVKFTLP